MTKSLRTLISSAVLAASVVAAVATPAFSEGALTIARQQDSTTLDPIFTIQNADIWVMNNMNSQLVRVNRAGNAIEADLAETWNISDDGLTYTFNLRDGLKFSDGSDLNASDVKFSLERLRDADGSVMGGLFTVVEAIDTPDNRTVVVKLSQQSAPALSTLAMFAAAVVPEAAVNAAGEAFGSSPVGAGAFMLEEWRRGEYLRLAKNPHHWEADRVQLDTVEWQYVPNDNARLLKLQAGEVDAVIFVPFNRVSELEGNADINVHLDASSRMDHLLVNHANGPLDDVRVRRALYLAIDRQSIVDAVTFGHGTVANSFIPARAMYHNPDNQDYPFDPDGAKALLSEAGVTDLELDLLITAGDSVHDQIGVIIKDQLGKVGVGVNIVKQEEGQQWDSTVAGEYDISVNYWTNDIIDPDQKTTFVAYGDEENLSYYTRYHNPEVSALIEQGRVELNDEVRRDIYFKVQRMAKADVHWVDLYYSPFRNASRSTVAGFFQNPMGRFMLEDTTLE